MIRKSRIVWTLCFLNAYLASFGQSFRFADNFQVFENNQELPNPFVGGLNAIHPFWIDLNEDNQEELVIFDRSTDLAIVYTTKENELKVDQELALKLPPLDNWLIIID